MEIIIKNLIVIAITLVVCSLLIFMAKKVIDRIFNLSDKIGNFLTQKLSARLKKNRWNRACLEILFLIATLLLMFISFTQFRYIALVFYAILVLILGSLIKYIREESPDSLSILQLLSNKVNKKNYFINRLILMLEQCDSILLLIGAIVVTLSFIIQLKWPNSVYYGAVLVVPLYVNMWIYFTLRLKFRKEQSIVNIRRLIAYLSLLVLVVMDSYMKFYYYFFEKEHYKKDGTFFLLYIASIIFIAIDRFLKALIEDYKKFKEQIEEDSSSDQ
ncbi:MAG: hypothetical protein K9L17_08975 [Clostridiales bacterium]|nr:hypothetical protein [Clostridiales bacterium]MCF8022809.1 hypothetical protein [Clostridiales bacterium]